MPWRSFLRPKIPEERAITRALWEGLPAELRTRDQGFGRWSTGCGATWGVMERCDFGCTACYLGKGSNEAAPLPLLEVCKQLDTLRARLGPGARVQITAGEVTLLPCAQLVRIIREARERGLVPMVMTHGQRFLRDPDYLERLMREGGLDRLAMHIDTTQRGRDGGDPTSEAELMGVRDAMADLVRGARRRTGLPLHLAHTVTITPRNLPELPDIVRWCVRNVDAVRLLALQPLAQVGRTREAGRPDHVWQAVCEGIGRPIHDHTWQLGHPDCNQFACLWICGRHVVEVVRARSGLDRWFMSSLLAGGLAGWTPAGEPRTRALARLAGRLARDPRPLLQIPLYCAWRLLGNWRLLQHPRPLVINVHHFMDATEMGTPRGCERIQSCVFRVPVDGRLVSMCEFNGQGLRQARIAPLSRQQPGLDEARQTTESSASDACRSTPPA